ncbi:MAG: hypothetical protein B7Z78_03005 [Rhodospirillales bacterium 20-60-12]|nr:MAG: hypothetical protein B7Z78_03005 [Rhodospirillales bacterium 20-60-12]HQT66643.1 tetratricopeptide repeat protein [Acetobacteraceae bacterium]
MTNAQQTRLPPSRPAPTYAGAAPDGAALYRAGDYQAACAAFEQALRDAPADPRCLINLANAHWAAGQIQRADDYALAALALAPDYAQAWMIAGAVALAKNNHAGALAHYHQAVALRPNFAPAQAGLAAALLAAGQHDAAIAAAEAALALQPDLAHAAYSLGCARAARGAHEQAIAAYDLALSIEPRHARARLNRGNALAEGGQLAAARRDIEAAIAIQPDLPEAHASLGFVLTAQGHVAAARQACRKAIAIAPDCAAAHWNFGVACLLEGDFAAGFEAYEWRKSHPQHGRHFLRRPGPVWQGDSLAGKSLLVSAEQGFGDAIMFARFLPTLAARARSVTLHCAPALVPLLDGLAGIRAVAFETRPPDYDLHVDQMSLARLLAITPANIPGAGGYLTAQPDLRAQFAARLPPERNIGLVWAGNPAHHNDRNRSLPAGALAPLQVSTAHLVSLQCGPRAGEMAITDLTAELTDFARTAALIACLDAVLTVDSAVAHLAGALGVPCHVLLPHAPDWRWQLHRPDTPWYRSITLHRQPHPQDWATPIRAAAIALRVSPASNITSL